MAEPATRKALAFARFAARWPRYNGRRLQDFFYDQACAALGICNHSTWVRISPNDPRWDVEWMDELKPSKGERATP